jgi:hypothetical protein
VALQKFLSYLICPELLNFKIVQLTVSETEGILFNIFYTLQNTVLLIVVFLNYSLTVCAISCFFNNKEEVTSFPMSQQSRLFVTK